MIATRTELMVWWSPRSLAPITFGVRVDTNDGALVAGILGEDEYHLHGLAPLSGWALDIGAHIGIVAIALATDHPGLKVVAVEALPENVATMRENVARNRLDDRVFVESAAATAPGVDEVGIAYGWAHVDGQPDHYMAQSKFIGGMCDANDTGLVAMCPAVSLDSLLAKYAIDRVALLKIDCEGCEYQFLDTPAVARVDRILGEFHSGLEGIMDLLAATHDVTIRLDRGGVGIFDAVLR